MRKLFTLFLFESLLINISASAYDFSISGFDYIITSNVDKTVNVVGRTDANATKVDSLIIPSTITYNVETYKDTTFTNNVQKRTLDEIITIASQKFEKMSNGKTKTNIRSSLKCIPSSKVLKRMASRVEKEAFYLCSSPAGNIIVSADLRMDPILGYSDKPIKNFDSIPEGLKYLLDLYAQEHDYIVEKGFGNKTILYNRSNKAAVTKGPLITTQWGQNEPYNNSCPQSYGKRCVTGCVATAMAQIMNYYKYPNNGSFDWNNMANTYYSYTEEQAAAVAKLMISCGSAVGMSYGTNQSVAYDENVNKAFVSRFGYLGSIAWVNRSMASSESWNELIMSEIDNLHPIYYSGKSNNNYNSVGHAFIVDGYQTSTFGTTLFHVNFGWDGDWDGYYSLGNLNGYNYYQGAYVNIKSGEESLLNDGGVFQAGDLLVSSTILVTNKSTRLSLSLNDAVFHRYTAFPSDDSGNLKAYFVNTTSNQKYSITSWSYQKNEEESTNFVCRNISYTPRMPEGTYYVQFYSSNGSGSQVPVTISNDRKEIRVVSSEVTEEYVDLGLPSRTLWANKNVGAKRPEDVGLFYAWAETDATKSQYTTDTYKYYSDGWTKYTSSDGKSKLEANDDAATKNWGGNWVTPTYTQMKELVNNCEWIYTCQNGVWGYQVVGPNGNSIFIPFSGILGTKYQENEGCGYWTSTRYNDSSARIMRFTASEVSSTYYGYREWGRPIRPVYAIPMISVSGIALSQHSLQLFEGDTETITATVSPANAFNKTIIWSSSNTNVATVNNGKVTAISPGEAIITATATDGSGVKAQCVVTVKLHEQKDLIYSERYGDWTSSFKYNDCYESKTIRFYAEKGDELSFDWVTSSEEDYDYLVVKIDGNTILSESGLYSGTSTTTIESDGNHTLIVSWSKDGSESGGNDEVSVNNINIKHYHSFSYRFINTNLGSWTSTNHSDYSRSSNSYNFTSEEGDVLQFYYYISSEYDYDIGYVFLDGSCILSVSGNQSSTISYTLSGGSHYLECIYEKDGSESSGNDSFTVSNISVPAKSIISETGMKNVSLSSNAKSIQVYKDYNTICSYEVETNNQKWQSLILPFELSYSQWCNQVEIARIDSIAAVYNENGTTVHSITMYASIIEEGTIESNRPYLIRNLQNNTVTLTNDNGQLRQISNKSVDYYYNNLAASIYPIYSQIYSNNYWVDDNELSKTNRSMNIYHWYLTLNNSTGDILDFSNNIEIHFHSHVLKGDVNNDGEVDITDVVCIVNHILGNPVPVFIEEAADVNDDQEIDISDVVGLVNIILGQ